MPNLSEVDLEDERRVFGGSVVDNSASSSLSQRIKALKEAGINDQFVRKKVASSSFELIDDRSRANPNQTKIYQSQFHLNTRPNDDSDHISGQENNKVSEDVEIFIPLTTIPAPAASCKSNTSPTSSTSSHISLVSSSTATSPKMSSDTLFLSSTPEFVLGKRSSLFLNDNSDLYLTNKIKPGFLTNDNNNNNANKSASQQLVSSSHLFLFLRKEKELRGGKYAQHFKQREWSTGSL